MEKLGPLNLYTLRLIGMHNRFYKPRQSTTYLERHGFIERTGWTEANTDQIEFAITDKGRSALEETGRY
jgi:DNA-binding PadR family transcriptional regulator